MGEGYGGNSKGECRSLIAYLKRIPPEYWSKSAFRPGSKSDRLLNNMCETFNSVMLKPKEKPIITMLDEIRVYMMERWVKNRKDAEKLQPLAVLPENILAKLNVEEKSSKASKEDEIRIEVIGDKVEESRPSTTWRSLVAGRKLLAKGPRRSIGDGLTTWIRRDLWIPFDQPTIVETTRSGEVEVERVRNLMTECGNEWDIEKLSRLFDADTCRCIRSIPPNRDQGIIPAIEALEHRGMTINEAYGICNIASEDVFHALIDCSNLQYLWVVAKFDYSSCVMGAFMNIVQFPHDPVFLEAMAVKRGLELARDVGCSHIMMEGDARMVIDMLKTQCNQASTLNSVSELLQKIAARRPTPAPVKSTIDAAGSQPRRVRMEIPTLMAVAGARTEA
ncbi:putative transcription factor interactor and regulator CCHC(Zn) family [Senna tora]|uniref:Putative transcription factor interactor and regulator CCHC(Zn) family n=1 Tax=Senna tora TaxID=362788 RepID=A0A834TR07_9FABA|nr:putative transcription factor interactor and regulator CCHC(Zn) family [Senna tora]